MQHTIRQAETDDAHSIAALSDQLGYPADTRQIKARLETILSLPDNCVYVAVLQEKIVGWIHGFHTFRVESDDFVEIAGLVVDETTRKMGLGTALIEHVQTWAQTKGCTSLRVRCNTMRTESHKFYLHLGFSESKEQKVFGKVVESVATLYRN